MRPIDIAHTVLAIGQANRIASSVTAGASIVAIAGAALLGLEVWFDLPMPSRGIVVPGPIAFLIPALAFLRPSWLVAATGRPIMAPSGRSGSEGSAPAEHS